MCVYNKILNNLSLLIMIHKGINLSSRGFSPLILMGIFTLKKMKIRRMIRRMEGTRWMFSVNEICRMAERSDSAQRYGGIKDRRDVIIF